MPPSASQESMATTSVSGDGSELGVEEEEDDFARMVSDSRPSIALTRSRTTEADS